MADLFDRFIDEATASIGEKLRRTNGIRGTLRYPEKDDNKYLGRLTFEVVDEDEYRVDLADDFISLGKNFGSFFKGFGEGLAGVFGIGDENNDETIKSVASSFTGLDKTTLGSNAQREFKAATDFNKIVLYLPQALNIQDAVAYDTAMNLGRIGALAEGSLLTGKGSGTAFSEAMGAGAAEALGGVFGGVSPDAASILSQNLAKRYITEGAGNAIGLATQTSLNPNTRTMFQSVPIRQFSFSFTMIATSSTESDQIEEIIKSFRTELYPEAIVAGGIDYGYRFPRRFLIKATYDNKEWPGIKFLPCYLQSFQTVYNPNGMGFHKDGKWSEVQITMAFAESRALNKNDIKGGY